MKKITILLILLSSLPALAQKKQADTKFELYQYSESIPLYQQYLQKNPADIEASRNLALSYRNINDIASAINQYKSIMLHKNASPDDWFDLVQMLRITGNLTEARHYAEIYQMKSPGEKAANLLRSIDLFPEFMSGQSNYQVTNKTAHLQQSVFAPVFHQQGLLVTAENLDGKDSEWTGRGFTKLYLTDFIFSKLTPFVPFLMSKKNDGPAVLSTDGNTLYYTTVNPQSVDERDINTSKLQITTAAVANGQWEMTDVFRFNNEHYNLAHPALSWDQTLLVFSSDKPGGKGGMDLYYCKKSAEDSWSEPLNIATANTSENEIFPSFDASGNLYFASNGLPGLGGLDIFFSAWDGQNFGQAVNLKSPINSSYDDFAIATNDTQDSGFFSTNRFGNTKTDDIASFMRNTIESPKNVAPPSLLITVTDKHTSIPLPYVLITVKDDKSEVVFQGMTDPSGKLTVDDLIAGEYRIQGMLNDVTTSTAKVLIEEFSNQLIEKELTHNDPRFTLSGIVTNAHNGQPVSGVSVKCVNTLLNRENIKVTGSDGKFFFQLEQSSDFKVTGAAQGWLSSEVFYETTKGLDRSTDLYVQLKLNMQQPVADEVIRLDKIYYDYDKCDIKTRSAEELDRLVQLMNDFPDMVIELSSHTDSRGSDSYNIKLSQCRADAALAYILAKGIEKRRILAVGYGETRLVNGCGNGIECNEKQHQKNRRTEFKILQCESCPGVVN